MNKYIAIIKETLRILFKHLGREKVKDAFKKASEAFKEVLWKEIKVVVYEQALLALEAARDYCNQEQVKLKKEELISQVFEKIKLPLLLRPFKKLLKGYINQKVEEIISSALQRSHDFLTE